MDGSMEIELSAETAALAAALTEKDPVTALAGAKLALGSGAEADAALQALDAAQLAAFFHYTAAQRGSAGSACPKLELFELVLQKLWSEIAAAHGLGSTAVLKTLCWGGTSCSRSGSLQMTVQPSRTATASSSPINCPASRSTSAWQNSK